MAGTNTRIKLQNPHGSRPARAPFRAPAGGVYLSGNEARRRLNVEQVRSAALSACVVVLAEQLRDLDASPADGMLRRARPFLCAEDVVKADALLARPQVGLQPVRWWMIKRRMWWLPKARAEDHVTPPKPWPEPRAIGGVPPPPPGPPPVLRKEGYIPPRPKAGV